LLLFLNSAVYSNTHIEYVDRVDHELLIKFGFEELEPGLYHTTFKEYDKNGKFVKTSELYIKVKEFLCSSLETYTVS